MVGSAIFRVGCGKYYGDQRPVKKQPPEILLRRPGLECPVFGCSRRRPMTAGLLISREFADGSSRKREFDPSFSSAAAVLGIILRVGLSFLGATLTPGPGLGKLYVRKSTSNSSTRRGLGEDRGRDSFSAVSRPRAVRRAQGGARLRCLSRRTSHRTS